MYAFFGLSTALLILLSVLLGYGRRQEIIANWKDYRFKPLILLSAFLYKPSTDPRSRWQFADDNFREGILLQLTTTLKMVLEPLMNVFLVMGTSLNQSANNVESIKRVTEATAATFERIFSIFEQRFITTLHGLRMTFFRLNTAMQRIWASAVSSLWQAYSTIAAVMSTVDLIIKIIIIILVVLLAMLIFLFLFMWPFIPLILSVVGILVTAGAGAAVGGMASTFCFGPDAHVCMADGTNTSIASLKIGDRLADGGSVTSVFQFEGTPVRNLYGIPVTDNHIVFGEDGRPVFVSEHPDVGPYMDEIPRRVYCLNTTTHRIHVWSSQQNAKVTFADWEEMDDTDTIGLQTWNRKVFECLNPGLVWPGPVSASLNDEALFHPAVQVSTPDGPRDIGNIHPGMTVVDANGDPTRVTGRVEGIPPHTSHRGVSSAVWHRYRPRDPWNQVAGNSNMTLSPVDGSNSRIWISLFTESGTFYLYSHGIPVRDFSDVGTDKLRNESEWIIGMLNSSCS